MANYTIATCPKHGEGRFRYQVSIDRALCVRCESDRCTAHRRRNKKRLVAYLGGACRSCGYSRSVVALQFHHRDPSAKSFEVGGRNLNKKLDVLMAEADKCDLLCANCHAEEHDPENDRRPAT